MLSIKEWLSLRRKTQFFFSTEKFCYQRIKDGVLFRAGEIYFSPSKSHLVINHIYEDMIHVSYFIIKNGVVEFESDKCEIDALPLEVCINKLNVENLPDA